MYEGWTTEHWETPLSELRSVGLVHALHAGPSLTLTLEDLRSRERLRWALTFADAPIYRNILEEFRLELWGALSEQLGEGEWIGPTRRVPDSPWLAELRKREPLIEVHYPELIHFQVVTEDDVFDVLSPEEPAIEALGPAPEGAEPAGRSEVYYMPDDAGRLGGLLRRVLDGLK